MAKLLRSKVLFITTSPRTPEKMVPEIKLLHKHFDGQVWNTENQTEFMRKLKDEDFFYGQAENDPASPPLCRCTSASPQRMRSEKG